jgi:hypothetical protein
MNHNRYKLVFNRKRYFELDRSHKVVYFALNTIHLVITPVRGAQLIEKGRTEHHHIEQHKESSENDEEK